MKKILTTACFIFISNLLIIAQINLSPMWPSSDYWKPETYPGHAGTNQSVYKAVDFYYSNKNRPNLYRNGVATNIGRDIYSPHGGQLYLFLYETDSISTVNRNFEQLNNVLQVIQGQAPIPKKSFWMYDIHNKKREVDYEVIIDSANKYTSLYAHLQISDEIFNQTIPVNVEQKIRSAIGKLYDNTAYGNTGKQRVAINTGRYLGRREIIGRLNMNGLAGAFHLHFMIYKDLNFSESLPTIDPNKLVDLKNSDLVQINNQKIFFPAFEHEYPGRPIYQYPSILRINLSANVIVNCMWDNNASSVFIRESPGGPKITAPNGTPITIPGNKIGMVLEGPQKGAITPYDAHLWYKIQFPNITGWVAAEYLDNHIIGLVNYQLNLFSGLNLISFPILPSPSKFSDIFSSLGSNFLPYVFYVNDAGVLTYKEASQLDAIPKKGYFISLTNAASVNVQGYATNKTLILKRGMNIVGVTEDVIPPLNSSVYRDAFYLASNGTPQHTDMFVNGLQRGKGYFIFSDIENNVLISDGSNIIAKQNNGKEFSADRFESIIDFAGSITITQDNSNTVQLKFGIKPGALDGNDEFDVLRAIPSPGDLIGFFDDAFGYKESYKSYSSNKEWPVAVITPSEIPNNPPNLGQIRISWSVPSLGSIPSGSTVKLLDENRNVIVPNMLTTTQWNFIPSSASTLKKFFIQTYIPTQQGSAPIATTLNTSNISQTSARIYGSFNPQGSETHVYFKYGLSANTLTDSTNQVNLGSGTTAIEKNETLINLLPSTNYFYRAVANNSYGYSVGDVKYFMTSISNGSPEVITFSATNVTNSSAQLNGTINPNGLSTIYYFEYGATPQYGNSSIPFSLEASNQYQEVNFTLAGLQPNETYHYRLVAQNNSGTNSGGNVSFVTSEVNSNSYWTQTSGPKGGYVNRLTSIDNILLAGVGGGIYLSENQALSWTKSKGIPGYDFAKSAQGILYAASRGLYRSTDNGLSWYIIGLENEILPSIAINQFNHIFIGTVGSGIYRSTDNGNSWEQVYSGNQNIYSLRIDYLGNIYAGTLNNDIRMLKSTDSGNTWLTLNPTRFYIYNIFITPNNHLYIATALGISYSTNGGINWNDLNTFAPGADSRDILVIGTNIYAASPSTGNDGLYKSTDNGSTWNPFNNGLLSSQFASLCKDNNGNIYCGSAQDGVYKLNNLSNQWIRMNDGVMGTKITLLTHTSGGFIFAADRYQSLFRSTNSGTEWNEINISPEVSQAQVMGLDVANNDYLYISIYGKGLYRSINLGNSWQKINPQLYNYPFGLYVRGNRIYCYAVNVNTWTQKFLYSNNYGNVWAEFPWYGNTITKITGNSLNELFAMISLGDTLYKSTNNGETWKVIPLNSNLSAKNCIYSDENYFYIGLNSDGLVRTNNDGLTWEMFNNGLELPIGVRAIDKNSWGELLIATTKGFYKYDSSINMWIKNADGLTTENIESITINNDGIIYLGTTGNSVFKSQYSTTNAYQIVQPNGGEELIPGDAYNIIWQSNGMSSTKLEYSTNSGVSWNTIIDTIAANTGNFIWTVPNTPSNLCKIRIISNLNSNHYDVSDNIFTIIPITEIEEENKIYNYTLAQNFPNPFNPTTTIRFSIAETSPVLLKIYDILGREVMKVVDENLIPGNYSYGINASNLASGIYIYRIQAGKYFNTKKFVLMK